MTEYLEYVQKLGIIGLLVFFVSAAFVTAEVALVIGAGACLAVVALDLFKIAAISARVFFTTQAVRTSPEYKSAVNLER